MKDVRDLSEVVRFAVNGLIATSVHFTILYLCVNFFVLPYTGISSLIGAIFGTISSFLGNKFYVFRYSNNNNILTQTSQFAILYTVMALNHGLFIYLWSDLGKQNFMLGFVLITFINTVLSFLFNKYRIFK